MITYTNNDIIIWLVVILFSVALSNLITKFGQPSVLGEILVGVIITIFAHYNVDFFKNIPNNPVISFLAEFGVILLLFEIGLESNIQDIKKSGKYAIITSILGVIIPFTLGYYILSPVFLKSSDPNLALFMGATLSATSTGISIRVFKELKILKTNTCQIVLTASLIDDVIGLISLTFVTSIISYGVFNQIFIAQTLVNVIIFFGVTYIFGKMIMPKFVKFVFYKISNKQSIFLIILVGYCLLVSWVAHAIGLASIIGGFLAGIFLDKSIINPYKKSILLNDYDCSGNNPSINNTQNRLEQLILQKNIKPLSHIFVPIFFVYAGMQVDIIETLNPHTLLIGFWISIIAIISKVMSGLFLPKNINRWIVGFGMVPRGEIGIIFAITGKQLGIINNNLFAAILLMIMITSIITPIALTKLANNFKMDNRSA